MVSTAFPASVCSCCSWEGRKCDFHPYIYDVLGLLLMIVFALITLQSKGSRAVSRVFGWGFAVLYSSTSYLVNRVCFMWHGIIEQIVTLWLPMEILLIPWARKSQDHPIKRKCTKHRRLCELWIDFSELLCYLYRLSDQLNPVLVDCCCGFENYRCKGSRSMLTTYLFEHLDSVPLGYERFIACLKQCTERPDCHLGHCSLLELLTCDDTILLESAEYNHNLVIREIIKSNLPEFVTMTDVNQLLPLLEKRQLLTDDDKDVLRNTSTTSCAKARYLLTDFLYSKGHQGYIRYYECLQEELSHSGHRLILKMINKCLKEQQICIPEVCVDRGMRIWFKAKGILGTKEYFQAFENLMFICLSSNTKKLDEEIHTFVVSQNRSVEAKAVGLLIKAASFKLRGKFRQLAGITGDIELYIDKMNHIENKRLIHGNWLLLLSCLKRHEGKFQEARSLLDQAKAELFSLASGDDLASVYYSEASLLIEDCGTLQEEKRKQVLALLHNSMRCATLPSRGMSIRQARCHLKLALCHMGSSLKNSRTTQRRTQLEKAKTSLAVLERQYDSLPLRLQVQYCIVSCDYYRGAGEKRQAMNCLQKGQSLIANSKLKLDQDYLNGRV